MSRLSGSEPGHRPDASRRQLVEIAIDCFALHGFQGTSIDRIARSAGVTKGALYYHFKDKEDLLLEAVKDRIGEFEVQVRDAVAASDDTHERLKRVIDACFVTATASNHRRFIITLMVEALDTNPRLSEQFRKVLRRMRGFLADVVADGQRRGIMRADVQPAEAAALIAGTIMGAEIQHYQDPGEVDLRRVLDAHLRQLADWLAPAAARAGRV
jgi:TetR/AcrR family acrAB operon transcriptional repressor